MKRQDRYPTTDTFVYFNANPKNRVTGDCVIRAISKATGLSWEEVSMELAISSVDSGYAPASKENYGRFLESHGFAKMKQPRKIDGKKYTAAEFCRELNGRKANAVYVVANVGLNHVVAIASSDGMMKVHDIWDCTDRAVGNYWIMEF